MSAFELQELTSIALRYKHRLNVEDVQTYARVLQSQIPSQGKRCPESITEAAIVALDRMVDGAEKVRDPANYARRIFRAIVTGEEESKRLARLREQLPAPTPQRQVETGRMSQLELEAENRKLAIERWRNRIATGERGLECPHWALRGWPNHHGPGESMKGMKLRPMTAPRPEYGRGLGTLDDAMSEAMSPLLEARDDSDDWAAAAASGARAIAAAGLATSDDEEEIF